MTCSHLCGTSEEGGHADHAYCLGWVPQEERSGGVNSCLVWWEIALIQENLVFWSPQAKLCDHWECHKDASLETFKVRLDRLWATWSSWRCPCSLQGGWARWPLKVPSSPNYSMILWSSHMLWCTGCRIGANQIHFLRSRALKSHFLQPYCCSYYDQYIKLLVLV